MESQQKKDKGETQNVEDLKSQLEKQIAAAVWIQAFGVLMETILFQRLIVLSEENIEGETISLTGSVIQLSGLIAEAVGETEQAFNHSLPFTVKGQKVAITGNWLQSLGSAIKAIGGEKVLLSELLSRTTDFVE